MIQNKTIYCGDNARTLSSFPASCVDLIYIDPPFNSGAEYEIIWKSPEPDEKREEQRSFDDRFGDVSKYIAWLEPRAVELVRVLKSSGSFFFHCDVHANYAIRALLQDKLGLRFQAEIVWKRSSAHSSAKRPGPVHDTIFHFTKSDNYTWNQQYQPLPKETADQWYNNVEKDTGRRFNRDNLTAPGKRAGASGLPWRGVDPTAKGRHWAVPRSMKSVVGDLDPIAALDALDRAGRIFWPKKVGGAPMLKRYLDESQGVPVQDVWTDIAPLNNMAPERVGYPTQKPYALLERIIRMASNPGDLVLDAFCGCGTALVAAERLKRGWVGVDVSPTACRVVANRLWRDCRLRGDVDFHLHDVPKPIDDLRAMHAADFENWAVIAIGGLPNQRKVNDKGIDGRIYDLVGKGVPKEIQTEIVYAEHQRQFDFIPIQVKQKDKAGRVDVDNFETALRRVGKTFGIIIAFDFTKDAKEEIKRVKKADGVTILPMTVKEILERQAA